MVLNVTTSSPCWKVGYLTHGTECDYFILLLEVGYLFMLGTECDYFILLLEGGLPHTWY